MNFLVRKEKKREKKNFYCKNYIKIQWMKHNTKKLNQLKKNSKKENFISQYT